MSIGSACFRWVSFGYFVKFRFILGFKAQKGDEKKLFPPKLNLRHAKQKYLMLKAFFLKCMYKCMYNHMPVNLLDSMKTALGDLSLSQNQPSTTIATPPALLTEVGVQVRFFFFSKKLLARNLEKNKKHSIDYKVLAVIHIVLKIASNPLR